MLMGDYSGVSSTVSKEPNRVSSNLSLVQPIIGCLPFLVSFPTSPTSASWITSQINNLQSNTCLRPPFLGKGNQRQKPIIPNWIRIWILELKFLASKFCFYQSNCVILRIYLSLHCFVSAYSYVVVIT